MAQVQLVFRPHSKFQVGDSVEVYETTSVEVFKSQRVAPFHDPLFTGTIAADGTFDTADAELPEYAPGVYPVAGAPTSNKQKVVDPVSVPKLSYSLYAPARGAWMTFTEE